MDIIGKLVKKLERETGVSKAGKPWEKQCIVVEQASANYNKEVVITFFADKVKSLRDIIEGDEVNVSINLSSKEYKDGKYFHNIDGWFIAKFGQETVGKNSLENKETMLNGETDSPF